MRTGILAVTLLIWGNCSALAAPLEINTHTAAVPEQAFKLAATWFLPDWQAGISRRLNTAPNKSGDLTGGTCESLYGLSTSCTAPKIIKSTHNLGKMMCYECKCPSSYQYSSCASGYVLAGGSCNGKYLGCDAASCPSGYSAGRTCGTGYTREVKGKSGSADCVKCVAKTCATDYTAGLANCNGQTHPNGWNYASSGYSGDKICGKCTAKTCPTGFTAGITKCSNTDEWTYSTNGYAGNSVCGKCTAKVCVKPTGSCWTLNSSGTAAGCSTNDVKVYRQSKLETVTDNCNKTYTRYCYPPLSGYGWNEVSANQILYYSADSLTLTPIIPTGGQIITATTGETYALTRQYYKSCDKYYRRDCKLYNNEDQFYLSGSEWNEGSSATAPSTTIPTTPDPYGYPNPYTVSTEERNSDCGWKYTRSCYKPAGTGWQEIADTASTPTVVLPSAVPTTPSSSCSSPVSGEYMGWTNNQPVNCSGTIKFFFTCNGDAYFKCVYDGSSTTSVDLSTLPTNITGKTLKPLKLVGERGLTTTAQTLRSCGKSYQRTCKALTDEGLYYVLKYGQTATNMVSSCGVNYGKKTSSTCAISVYPGCSNGSWFEIKPQNKCLTYQSCSPVSVTPSDSSGTSTTPSGYT